MVYKPGGNEIKLPCRILKTKSWEVFLPPSQCRDSSNGWKPPRKLVLRASTFPKTQHCQLLECQNFQKKQQNPYLLSPSVSYFYSSTFCDSLSLQMFLNFFSDIDITLFIVIPLIFKMKKRNYQIIKRSKKLKPW